MSEVLSEEAARARAREMLQDTNVRLATKGERRARFFAAAWMCGASWSQLGSLYGVSRYTTMDAANKWLPPQERELIKRKRPKLTHERLSAMYEWYKQSSPASTDNLTVIDLAVLMSQGADAIEKGDST